MGSFDCTLIKLSFDFLIHDTIRVSFLYSLYVTNFRPPEGNSFTEIQILNYLATLPNLDTSFWGWGCVC